ncbi:hypothetical protein HFP67_28840 [Bacillus sp. CB102A.1]
MAGKYSICEAPHYVAYDFIGIKGNHEKCLVLQEIVLHLVSC